MSVVGSANAVAQGWSLKTQWGADKEVTVVYEVVVDDRGDGPLTVQSASGLPRLYDGYACGNDSDPLIRCRSQSFSNPRDRIWQVACTYGPYQAGQFPADVVDGRDSSGVPTSDPLREALPFRTGSYKRVIPVTKAKNITPFFPRAEGTEGPVTNSAHDVLKPGLEMDYAMLAVYVTGRSLNVPSGLIPDYINAINEDQFELEKPGAHFIFLPYTCKCDDIQSTFMIKNNQTFWEFNLTLVVDDLFTWRPDVLDEGFHARCMEGDPDGRGGIISTGDIPAGQPQVRVLQDVNGRPLQSPVLLDGNGQPLAPGLPAVYLTYAILPEKSFTYLAQLLGLVEW